MNRKDYVGKRGEILFRTLITKWCGGEPWFDDDYLGEKRETKDFAVNLVEPSSGDAYFFVQVKATEGRYTGTGSKRRLGVKLTKKDMSKLKRSGGPAFVFGIDIVSERGYFVQISKKSPASLSGIPLRNRINCKNIRKIWESVNDYWINKKMLPDDSPFDISS